MPITSSPKHRRRSVRTIHRSSSSKHHGSSKSRRKSIPATVLTSSGSSDEGITTSHHSNLHTQQAAAVVTPTDTTTSTHHQTASNKFFDKFSPVGRRKQKQQAASSPAEDRPLGILRSPFEKNVNRKGNTIPASAVRVTNKSIPRLVSPVSVDEEDEKLPSSPKPQLANSTKETTDDTSSSTCSPTITLVEEALLPNKRHRGSPSGADPVQLPPRTCSSPLPLIKPSLNNSISSPSYSSSDSDTSSPEKMIHSPTARGQYEGAVSSNAATSAAVVNTSPVSNLRYPLLHGRKAMSQDMKRRSQETLSKKGMDAPGRTAESSETTATTTDAPQELNIKIFLLLISPADKTFELVQLMYPPSKTTVGDILNMIPASATEPCLGTLQYTGLIRPRRRAVEINQLDAIAAELDGVCTSPISAGEILVAVPSAFKARRMVLLGKQILANPRIQQLLKQQDPLNVAAAAARKKLKHKRTSSKSMSQPKMSVVQEEDEHGDDDDCSGTEGGDGDDETTTSLQRGLERAKQKAEAANAETTSSSNASTATEAGPPPPPSGPPPPPLRRPSLDAAAAAVAVNQHHPTSTVTSTLSSHTGVTATPSIVTQHTPVLAAHVLAGNYNAGEEDDGDDNTDSTSLQGSLHSWSASFDRSVVVRRHQRRSSSGNLSLLLDEENTAALSRRRLSSKKRRRRRLAMAVAQVLVAWMVYTAVRFYFLEDDEEGSVLSWLSWWFGSSSDNNNDSSSSRSPPVMMDENKRQPMGVWGFLQLAIMFGGLIQWQVSAANRRQQAH